MGTTQPAKTSNQTISSSSAARIAGLVRAGLMPASKLSTLKMALKNHQQKKDITKLPKIQRDVLQQYYQSTSDAALQSQSSYGAVRRNIMAGYEIHRDEYIAEASTNTDPPAMLVLKRRGIRIFPDGKRVALYTNTALGVTVSVPYTANGIEKELPLVTAEGVEHVVENIEHIAKIVKTKQAKTLKFTDGSSALVDGFTASAIHQLHKAVNDQNKAKIAKMVKHSPDQLAKVAAFAFKHSTK